MKHPPSGGACWQAGSSPLKLVGDANACETSGPLGLDWIGPGAVTVVGSSADEAEVVVVRLRRRGGWVVGWSPAQIMLQSSRVM